MPVTTNNSPSGERAEESAAKQTSVVFAGQIAATGMGFVASLLTMRAVGPDGYGVIVVSTTVLTVIWLVTGRGVDQAMVRCAARSARDGPDSADAAFATVHQIKLALGGALVLVGLLLAVPLSRFFFGPGVSALALGVAVVASLAATLWSYVGASLQATFRFRRFALVQTSNAAVRLLLTVALVAWGILSPVSAMVIVGAAYLIAAGIGYALAPRARATGFSLRGTHADLRPMIFRYSKWLVVSSVIHIFYTRLDHLMLSGMVGTAATGTYGAAVSFIQLVDLLTFSMLTVFLPRFCAHTDAAGLRRQAKQSIKVSCGLGLLLLPGYVLAGPIMRLLLGDDFAGSVRLFEIMFFGAIFTLLTHPLQAVLHARGETRFLTGLDIGLLIANGLGNFLAIPLYGATGAAVVALVTRLIGGMILLAIVYARLYARNSTEPEHADVATPSDRDTT